MGKPGGDDGTCEIGLTEGQAIDYDAVWAMTTNVCSWVGGGRCDHHKRGVGSIQRSSVLVLEAQD